jgi:hypothetical protein
MARAVLGADGGYHAHAPELVNETGTLLSRLAAEAGPDGTVLLGFDFPIGLPVAYAERAGVDSFPDFLAALGHGDWEDFYLPAIRQEQISPRRPFYPHRPGGTRQRHLLDAFGVDHIDQLRRVCERATQTRTAGAPLFWTLGAKQVGKAAISGWREVLAPGLRNPEMRLTLWPFDGPLDGLLRAGGIVVAETYPAECYGHLDVRLPMAGQGKRSQAARRANAPALIGWARAAGVHPATDLDATIRDGFGAGGHGEDPFDAVVGLFGMVNVVLGHREPGEPADDSIREIEGWILGQHGEEASYLAPAGAR